jgi:hypothetical protein
MASVQIIQLRVYIEIPKQPYPAKIPPHVGSMNIHMDHYGSIHIPEFIHLLIRITKEICLAGTFQMALNLEDVDDINSLEELKPMISTSVDAWIDRDGANLQQQGVSSTWLLH